MRFKTPSWTHYVRAKVASLAKDVCQARKKVFPLHKSEDALWWSMADPLARAGRIFDVTSGSKQIRTKVALGDSKAILWHAKVYLARLEGVKYEKTNYSSQLENV